MRRTKLLCFWLWSFYMAKVTVRAISYQGISNTCGQSFIFVNGQYRNTCPNGYLDSRNRCVPYTVPQCPAGYNLVNGFCYLSSELPTNICPPGYYLLNQLCFPHATPPCSTILSHTTQSSILITESTTAPTPKPQRGPEVAPQPQLVPDPSTRCPPDSIFIHKQCRKIICPVGEHYEGRCLQPACPEGTVWRGRRCQAPGYITTVIEIDNIFINEAHHSPGKIIKENENNYHTPKPDDISLAPTTSTPPMFTTMRTTQPTTRKPTFRSTETEDTCCSVLTPRICKSYSQKWICFNRRYKRCDDRICKYPKMYLRVPHVAYDPPILIMPPNPPLEVCPTPNCDNTDTIDCSGCQYNRRETCSPHCYHYQCPNDECDFIDLEEYCTRYPGEFGCKKSDGCIWDWCGN